VKRWLRFDAVATALGLRQRDHFLGFLNSWKSASHENVAAEFERHESSAVVVAAGLEKKEGSY